MRCDPVVADERANSGARADAWRMEPVEPAERAARRPPHDVEHLVPVDRALAALAAGQYGVVTRAQTLALGLTRHGVAHRVGAGRLHAAHRGVYAVGHPALSPHGRRLAAVLACGDGAWLSHRSAAVLYGLLPDVAGPLHVTVPVRRRAPTGVVLHRSRDAPGLRRERIPVTTPARTILDLAATGPEHELARAVEEARLRRLVTDGQLERLAGHRRGARALRELLDGEPSLTRSEAERVLLALVHRAGLPRPQTNVRVGRHEVDALWPAERLVVEVDGFAFHSSREAFERDRARDGDLQAQGLRVLRVTWRRLTERPEAVAALLGAALR
jgi:very-short-patch-repair endonuclease